mmetsp:Transcript_20033/g.43609  ORF Transcript_20033/g.43609 Transcript_20033/m.43609 type:complete len:288 (-) Transcript_20033:47-910(-)
MLPPVSLGLVLGRVEVDDFAVCSRFAVGLLPRSLLFECGLPSQGGVPQAALQGGRGGPIEAAAAAATAASAASSARAVRSLAAAAAGEDGPGAGPAGGGGLGLPGLQIRVRRIGTHCWQCGAEGSKVIVQTLLGLLRRRHGGTIRAWNRAGAGPLIVSVVAAAAAAALLLLLLLLLLLELLVLRTAVACQAGASSSPARPPVRSKLVNELSALPLVLKLQVHPIAQTEGRSHEAVVRHFHVDAFFLFCLVLRNPAEEDLALDGHLFPIFLLHRSPRTAPEEGFRHDG